MDLYWLGFIIASIIFVYWLMRSFLRQRHLPHGPLPYPLIGNILILKHDARQTLNRLAAQYGAVFTIWFGREPIVMVNDYHVAQEVFSNNGFKYGGRPRFVNRLLTKRNGRLPFMDYSPEFVKKQNVCIHACKIDDSYLDKCLDVEISKLCQDFSYQVVAKDFDPAPYFEDFVLSLLMRLVYGVTMDAKYSEFDLPGNKDLLTIANTTRLFLWLRLIRLGKYQEYKKFILNREKVLSFLFEKSMSEVNGNKSMASVILQSINDESSSELVDEANMLCSDLFLISLENVGAAMKWVLLYFIMWPEIQIKVQEELDLRFEKGKSLSVADAESIPYLQAAVYETLRLSSLNPISSLHRCMESVTLKGHQLPKNTCVCVNLNAIHRSSKYWENPFEFDPTRFLEYREDTQVLKDISKMKGFLAFGSGIRRCFGDELSMKLLMTVMANLCINFSFEIPPYSMRPDLGGLTKLVLVPRPYSVSLSQR